MTMLVSNVRSVSTAAASFAWILDFIRLGMAIPAMIRMMATTISNSINEKPRCLHMATPDSNSDWILGRVRGGEP